MGETGDSFLDLLNDVYAVDELFAEEMAKRVSLIQAWATWARFEEEGHYQPATPEMMNDVHERIGSWADAAFVLVGADKWNQKLAEFDYITDRFEPYASVSMHNGAEVISTLRTAQGYLRNGVDFSETGQQPGVGSVIGMMNTVAIHLSDWQGTAKGEFQRSYLEPFEGQHLSRANLPAELTAIVAAQQNTILKARRDALIIANQTVDALYAKAQSGSPSEGFTAKTLAVGGALLGVAAAIPTFGSSAVALAFAGGAMAFTANELSSTVTGGSVAEILGSMESQLAIVVSGVELAADDVGRAVDLNLDAMREGATGGGFNPDLVGVEVDPLAKGYAGFQYPDGLVNG